MKNIYFIDEYASSKINGIGTYINELMLCLKRTDVNFCLIVLCHETKMFKIEIDNNGITHMQFPVINGFYGQQFSVLNSFFRLYIEDSQDSVFIFNHTPNELLVKTVKSSFPLSRLVFVIHDMTWTGTMLGDKSKIKKYVLAENQKSFEKEYPDLFQRFNEEKRMFDTVHRIVALSPDTFELLQMVYSITDEKISYIPNGIQDTHLTILEKEKKQMKEKLFIPLHEKVIIFVGRAQKMKGIFEIINGLKEIVKTYPDFRLVIIGTLFEVKKIMEYTSDIAAKITFTGQISKTRLNEWYQIADIGVLASYSEQCNYSGIEMMMHGLPVVASDGFGIGAMFTDDVNAKIARIGDRNNAEEFENNLAETFLKLLQSESLCRKLGEKGRKIYESQYSINIMREGYRTLFNYELKNNEIQTTRKL